MTITNNEIEQPLVLSQKNAHQPEDEFVRNQSADLMASMAKAEEYLPEKFAQIARFYSALVKRSNALVDDVSCLEDDFFACAKLFYALNVEIASSDKVEPYTLFSYVNVFYELKEKVNLFEDIKYEYEQYNLSEKFITLRESLRHIVRDCIIWINALLNEAGIDLPYRMPEPTSLGRNRVKANDYTILSDLAELIEMNEVFSQNNVATAICDFLQKTQKLKMGVLSNNVEVLRKTFIFESALSKQDMLDLFANPTSPVEESDFMILAKSYQFACQSHEDFFRLFMDEQGQLTSCFQELSFALEETEKEYLLDSIKEDVKTIQEQREERKLLTFLQAEKSQEIMSSPVDDASQSKMSENVSLLFSLPASFRKFAYKALQEPLQSIIRKV